MNNTNTTNRFKIITADERLAQQSGIKGVIVGETGVGKTSLLYTLPEEDTLCLNLEAGLLSVQNWKGDTIDIRDWNMARDIACFIGGPNPAVKPGMPYSQQHYDAISQEIGEVVTLQKYNTIFIDSITEASRLAFTWSKQQPESVSDRTGKADNRAAYGLLGQEMIAWFKQLQHVTNKNIWFVGILEKKTDDYNRQYFAIQMEGSKAANEFPGIFDEVITMTILSTDDGQQYRAFICQKMNPWQYPAKDRSGKLSVQEEPNLGKLMSKIKNRKGAVE